MIFTSLNLFAGVVGAARKKSDLELLPLMSRSTSIGELPGNQLPASAQRCSTLDNDDVVVVVVLIVVKIETRRPRTIYYATLVDSRRWSSNKGKKLNLFIK